MTSPARIARWESPPNYCDRGEVYIKLGKPDAAMSDFNASLALNPDYTCTLLRRSIAYLDAGLYADAARDIDHAISVRPDNAEYHNHSCWVRGVWNRELDAARSECDRALVLKPGDAPTLDSRGFVDYRKRDFRAAVADHDAALAGAVKYPSSFYMRGLAKRKTGDTAGGDADIAAAKALDPKIADTYAKYGVMP
jgi:tetratricopeptide (TPR) repeat protein